jgi:hypothetical protein
MKRRAVKKNILFNKKGIELTMNTVIIAILVVIVLVVVVGFFLGGTNKMKTTVMDIFGLGTAGTDVSLAVEQCRNFCIQAENLPLPLRKDSQYCKHAFNLDTKNRGTADTYPVTVGDQTVIRVSQYFCTGEKLSVPCPGVLDVEGFEPSDCITSDKIGE